VGGGGVGGGGGFFGFFFFFLGCNEIFQVMESTARHIIDASCAMNSSTHIVHLKCVAFGRDIFLFISIFNVLIFIDFETNESKRYLFHAVFSPRTY